MQLICLPINFVHLSTIFYLTVPRYTMDALYQGKINGKICHKHKHNSHFYRKNHKKRVILEGLIRNVSVIWELMDEDLVSLAET